jgi:putative ABC transport system permease protein
MTILAELQEGLAISWNAIRANKLRSGLTTLGIIIGVITVTLMGAAISAVNEAFRQSISQIGSDVLYIQKFAWGPGERWWMVRNRRDITLDQGRRLAGQTTLARAVSIEAGRNRTVSYKTRTARSVLAMGNTEESALVRGLTVRDGRFLSAGEVAGARPVCVLGADLAANLFGLESPLGKKVKLEGNSYEVIGVLEKLGQFLFGNLDNQIIVPITRFLSDVTRYPDVLIAVKVLDIGQMAEAKEELIGIMRTIRRIPPGRPDDFAINQQDIILNFFNQVIGTIATAGLFITGLSLFVGGIGIMNIMFVSVTERTREIGIRKAIGAKRRTILVQFLMEAVMICLLGGLIALALAFPLTMGLGRLVGENTRVGLSLPLVGLALGVSILTGVVAGFIPAYRAARMNPVDALRNE